MTLALNSSYIQCTLQTMKQKIPESRHSEGFQSRIQLIQPWSEFQIWYIAIHDQFGDSFQNTKVVELERIFRSIPRELLSHKVFLKSIYHPKYVQVHFTTETPTALISFLNMMPIALGK